MKCPRTIGAAVLAAAASLAALAAVVFAQWPTTCVDLSDIVEVHLGNDQNVGIYQRVVGDQTKPGCRRDHQEDVRGVFAWAFDGMAASATPSPPPVVWSSVSAGTGHACGLRTDGNIMCWGAATDNHGVFGGQASPPAGTFQSVSAGFVSSCGVQIDGSVVCWGFGGKGRTTPPA